jgi:hypothetical protein
MFLLPKIPPPTVPKNKEKKKKKQTLGPVHWVQAASPSWLSRISIPYCVHHSLWLWVAELHDLWGYCVTGGDSFHTIMFICTCSNTYVFTAPKQPRPPVPSLKHWVYWLHDVTIPHWLGRVSVLYGVHHLFWPGPMVGTWIVGDGVSYEWWDWFQEIDFTWVH